MVDQSTIAEKDGHVHLKVTPTPSPKSDHWHPGLRWLVVALAASAIGLYVLAFFQPWWSFTLYAPQYPSGLRLSISLTGMGGDVHEIDMLNHYIGMGHLADAAKHERELAGYGVGLVSIMVLAVALLAGKKVGRAMFIPAVLFPIGFLGDAFYWLYTFGHRLDPHAPIHLQSFTPELFGNGQIGQFMTFATPSAGFWMACGGLVLVVAATFVRSKICADCPQRGDCKAVCPSALVGPQRKPKVA
jgi:copper chaperone NosL